MASFRQIKSGKWEAQVRRKGFKPISRSFILKEDAIKWARLKELEADRGELIDYSALGTMTLRLLMLRYMAEVTCNKKTAFNEAIVIKAFIRDPICRKTLDQLTAEDFARYRDKRLKHVKASSFNRELCIIRHALEVAKTEWGIPLKTNPAKHIRKPKQGPSRQRRVSRSEMRQLLNSARLCKSREVLGIILLAYETAMRRSEIIAIERKHINFEAKTLHIPFTKNGTARTIPLTGRACSVLRFFDNGSAKLFALSTNAFRLSWQRLIKRTDIQDLHFHDLRHEAISRFFERGLSVPEVALISGHKDYRMLARYTHMSAEKIASKLGLDNEARKRYGH